jgi:release factor glutamine methyltransferase
MSSMPCTGIGPTVLLVRSRRRLAYLQVSAGRRRGTARNVLLRPPGVYRVDSDTTLLIDVLHEGDYAAGRRVLDLGTGTGAIALAAARAGAASVTAVDRSLRSVVAAWLNTRLRGVPCTLHRGDLFEPVRGQHFDLIVTNPPYVAAPTDVLPRHRINCCWDGGLDGRAVLDRICAEGPALLAPEGMMLVVHSAICDDDVTLSRLADAGLRAEVLARCTVPFGSVMRMRAEMLEARGLVAPGQRHEELVVIGAQRPFDDGHANSAPLPALRRQR